MSARHPMSFCHSWDVVRKTRKSATVSHWGGYGFSWEEGGGAISRVLFPHGSWADGHLSGMAVASHLDAAYPQLGRPGSGLAAYLALLRLGVTVPRLLPDARWALTPPFHPYPWIQGGLFSVALSVALRRPGVTWQSTLRSSDFPQRTTPAGALRPSRPTATRRETYERSEEHTSELQSPCNLVCRLLLEKKNRPAVCSQTR